MNNLHDPYSQDGYRLLSEEYDFNNPEKHKNGVYINFYGFIVAFIVVIIGVDLVIGYLAKYSAVGIVVFTILAILAYICIIKFYGKHFVPRGYVR